MATCDSVDNDHLVTDLVQELSCGLEIPFLFNDSLSTPTVKNERDLLDNCFYESVNEYQWGGEDIYITTVDNNGNNEFSRDGEDDIHNQLVKNEVINVKSDSSGNGSGSESSLSEIWTIKNDLDTPPVTPPEERISPDNVFVFSSNNVKVIPVSQNNVLDRQPKKFKQSYSSTNKRVKIQPKPEPVTLGMLGTQNCQDPTIVCNVFKDVLTSNNINNSNSINSDICKEELNDFLNLIPGIDVRKSVLSRNELESLQAKRKQERMIRNRESAYLSRKRKKEYVTHLEKQVEDLTLENNQLKLENYNLRKRLSNYEEIPGCALNGKSRNIFADSPKKTTALLALMLTFCLNIGSFSNLLNETGGMTDNNAGSFVKEPIISFRSSDMRHTRSLLWTEPDLELKSSLSNLTKTSCPVYINQTESIRLESELRRWIGGDEDFSRPSKRNISKINQYFYESEKSPKHRKRKFRQRAQKKAIPTEDAGVDVFRFKPHLLSFDTFFEAIHRRDDTFYLVSFSGDHLLLPALAHNKTSRPKMSLMLPAFLSNTTSGFSSDQVELMQIDCEVTNTQLLSVNENDIPSHMKPYLNSTSRPKGAETPVFDRYFEDLEDGLLPKKNIAKKFNSSQGKNESDGVDPLNPPSPSNLSTKESTDNDLKSTSITPQYLYENKFNNNDWISNRLINKSKENVQFIDNSGKQILKNLMSPPPNASNVKPTEYGSKKSFEKNFKSGAKFLFP